MYQALRGALQGDGPYFGCKGRSQIGDREKVIRALAKRVLIVLPKGRKHYVLTAARRQALTDFERELCGLPPLIPAKHSS